MRTEDALRLLANHQTRILAQLDTSCALAGEAAEQDRSALSRVRWNLSRLLREYQLFKHVEIFDPAITRGGPSQAATARRMKENCVAAAEHYAAHVARWSSLDLNEHQHQYRAAVLAMAADLRAHVARERSDVERLLAGSARTRRLRPPTL